MAETYYCRVLSTQTKHSRNSLHCINVQIILSDSIFHDNQTVSYSSHNSIRLKACCTVHTEGRQMAVRAVVSVLTGDWLVPVCEHLVSHWFTHGLTPPYTIPSCTASSLHYHELTCLNLPIERVSSQTIYSQNSLFSRFEGWLEMHISLL